jgi:hypothetical protein
MTEPCGIYVLVKLYMGARADFHKERFARASLKMRLDGLASALAQQKALSVRGASMPVIEQAPLLEIESSDKH